MLFLKQISIKALNLTRAFHNILGSESSKERFAPRKVKSRHKFKT